MKNYTKETCYKLGTQGPFLFSEFIWTEKLTCWIVNSRSVEDIGRMPQAKWTVYTKIVSWKRKDDGSDGSFTK